MSGKHSVVQRNLTRKSAFVYPYIRLIFFSQTWTSKQTKYISLVEIASRHRSNTFNQSRTHPLWLLVVNTFRVSWVIVTAAKFLPPDCFSDVELLLRSNSTQATALAAITANATQQGVNYERATLGRVEPWRSTTSTSLHLQCATATCRLCLNRTSFRNSAF